MENLDHINCNIWIHCLLSTKEDNPIIQTHIKAQLLQLIEEEFLKMNCSVKIVNAAEESLNCLFKMNPEKSVQQIVNQIKIVSSDYISDSLGIEQSEVWEDDFSCFTVDSTGIEQSFDFIKDQDIRQL